MSGVIYQYGAPPFSFGSVDSVVPFAFALQEGVEIADLGAHEGKALLLVASPFNPNTSTSPTIYPAATHGRSSTPDDTPANTYVPSCLNGEINFGSFLFDGADPLRPGGATFGALALIDPEGRLDDLLDLGWDGAALELRRGEPGTDFSTWGVAAKLTASGILGGLDDKEIVLRDIGWKLATAALHDERYAGTGGIEGEAVQTGTPKPYCVGQVKNITPVAINTTLLILQISYTSIAAVSAVRDGGAALAFSADYASYAALAAAVVPGGNYATCLAAGLIRLGSTPELDVTCDVQGDADTFEGTPGPTTRGGVVLRIATGTGSVKLDTSEEIDWVSFSSFAGQQPAPVGWYWIQPVTKADALNEVLAGCLGFWMVKPSGQLALGLVDDPAASSPALVFDFPTIGASLVRVGKPTRTAYLSPRRGTFIGYGRNYTIQPRSQLATSVTEANVQLYGQATRYTSDESATIATNYPAAPTIYIDGGFRDEADALVEAERQQALHSVPRCRYTLPIVMDPLTDIVGQWVRCDNADRLGWGLSKSFLVCGIDAAANDIKLHLWG